MLEDVESLGEEEQQEGEGVLVVLGVLRMRRILPGACVCGFHDIAANSGGPDRQVVLEGRAECEGRFLHV